MNFKKYQNNKTKLTFKRIFDSFVICDSYAFKQNEVLLDKPIYLGFAVL